jgi:hypothetical protein
VNIEDKKALYASKIKHRIDWVSCEIKPPEGQEIWVLKNHWKNHFPSSFEIAAGQMETASDGTWRVNTCDYTGGGLSSYYPEHAPDEFNCETYSYWCHKYEIYIPEELIQWNWDCGID